MKIKKDTSQQEDEDRFGHKNRNNRKGGVFENQKSKRKKKDSLATTNMGELVENWGFARWRGNELGAPLLRESLVGSN